MLEVLTSDYTFVNERLARHYGIPDVTGNHFRRVTMTDDTRRGILGHGSVLTATSYANRTSPVKRGVWVLENLLGAPPPPPPADVPGLEDSESVADPSNPESRPRSVRERMERHRTDPVCASCHVRMDPLGFALESFDAVGGYRSLSVEDTSGTLPDGTELDGPSSVREMLLRNREDFVGTVTEKLMTYGLGRGVEYYDHPSIRRIVKEAEGDDYRWSSLILGYRRQYAVPDEEGPRPMIITKRHVPRRTFLRGVGATLALPLLDGMVPAFTPLRLSAAAPVRRLGLVYVPNGIVMDQWTPDETGTGFTMKPVMQSMEPYRNQLTVVSGLANKHGDALPGEGAGDHARAAGAFLTGVHPKKTAGADIRAGISMDQIAARELAEETQLVVPRAVARLEGAARCVRPRVQLRLRQHAQLAERDDTAADGEQPAGSSSSASSVGAARPTPPHDARAWRRTARFLDGGR